MNDLLHLPIVELYPPKNADVLQLYSFPTPNGVKISIALEEISLPYEVHTISIRTGDQRSDAFLALNPNGKIPAIVDPDGPDGRPVSMFESGAILLYLAEKTGKLLPVDPIRRAEAIQWLFFQMSAFGPMFGQLGHFTKFAPEDFTDPYPQTRYKAEVNRLLKILDDQLDGREFVVGQSYTIADISLFPWILTIRDFYKALDQSELDRYQNVVAWLARCTARPASIRGLQIPVI